MKRYFLLLLSVAFCLVLFVHCKRETADYRIKYLGDYHFNIHETGWMATGWTSDTLYSYDGNISNCSDDSSICIKYSNNPGTKTILKVDGKFNIVYSNPHQGFVGQFETLTKISFSFGNGGLGGGNLTDVVGNKYE